MKPYIKQCYYCWRRSRRESSFKIMRKNFIGLWMSNISLPVIYRLQPYEVPNFGLRSYPFCPLFIANIKAYFSFFLSRRAIKQCVGKNSVWRSVVNDVKQSVATLTSFGAG